MLPGECVQTGGEVTCDCNYVMKPQVCQSAAGYYIGYFCKNCGPYSRESGYFKNKVECEKALLEFVASEGVAHARN
jgi:hypothetical protein